MEMETDIYEVIEEGALSYGSFVISRAICKDNAKQRLLKLSVEPRINEVSPEGELMLVGNRHARTVTLVTLVNAVLRKPIHKKRLCCHTATRGPLCPVIIWQLLQWLCGLPHVLTRWQDAACLKGWEWQTDAVIMHGRQDPELLKQQHPV